MNQPSERALSLACVTRESSTSARMAEALLTLFPGATIELVDTGVERGFPEAIDCAVIDAGSADEGTDVLRTLRARGYAGAAVILLDPVRRGSAADRASADRLGARYCSLDGDSIAPLATAVTDSIRSIASADETRSAISLKALRQTQRLLAAGELATRLQHSLNNPIAALIAEAQLLELEPLLPDHRASVERIIELSRRVIDVLRALDGVGRA